MNDRPVVYVDMDNVLNKFWIGYNIIYNHIYSDQFNLTREKLIDYCISADLGITDKEEAKRLDHAVMSDSIFWRTIPVYDGAQEALKELNDRYDTYILTTPWVYYNGCVEDKITWMKSNFPFFDTTKMIFTWRKELLRGNVIIDDHSANLETFQGKRVAISYPYNMNTKVDFRSEDWSDIVTYLKEVL